jgi:hypothetical protein
MRKFLLIFLLFNFLFADDSELICIEAKLYPKIVMINENKNDITIDILYDKDHLYIAKKMERLLRRNHIKVKLSLIPNILEADAYILVTDKVDKSLKEKLLKKRKLIFSLYPEMIKDSMISLYLGAKIKPIINLYLIKKASIYINPIILKVAKIYEEN